MYAVNAPDGSRPEFTAEGLKARLPDLDRHDVFLCGPPGLTTEWFHTLREAGVPERRIHHESFEF
jgi:ferredoxin-NADP reductase